MEVPLSYLLGMIVLGKVPYFVSLVRSPIVIVEDTVVGLGAAQTAEKKKDNRGDQIRDTD